MQSADDDVRAVLTAHGRLPVDVNSLSRDADLYRAGLTSHASVNVMLSRDADLYRAGLTSHASVNVMLSLEDTFDVEFPDSMLRKSTFASIAAITDALFTLRASAPSRV